ncbi:MAG: acyl-CoA dehydrogenase family protein [Tepidiformaceae bacterium]
MSAPPGSEPDWPALAAILARRFAERAARHDRDASFPFDNFADLRESGFFAMTVPRSHGGYEAPLSTFLRSQEELAAGDGSTALALNMHLIRFGSEREARTYPAPWWDELCRGAVEEGWLCNTAATEEGLGSPAGGGLPETTATPLEGGWLLQGRKTFTTMAPILHYFIVMASIPEPSDGKPAIGQFMVLRDDAGVGIDPTWDSLGMRATGSHDLVLDGVRLPASRLLNRRLAGAPDARGAAGLTWFALGVAATTVGVARAARDYAVAFARERTPNDSRTIKDYPGVRTRIARIDLLLQRSRALIADAAAAWEHRPLPGAPPLDRVVIAKVDTLNNCIEAVDLAMRVVGGVSLTKRRPIERFYRDVRAGLHNPTLTDSALEQLAHSALDESSRPTRVVE